MARTISTVRVGKEGNRRLVVFDVAFGAGYVTGGEAFTPANVGLQEIEEFRSEDTAAGIQTIFDRGNNKLKLLVAAGTEQGNGTNPGVTVRCCARGIGL